jgi:hypothetical protein
MLMLVVGFGWTLHCRDVNAEGRRAATNGQPAISPAMYTAQPARRLESSHGPDEP